MGDDPFAVQLKPADQAKGGVETDAVVVAGHGEGIVVDAFHVDALAHGRWLGTTGHGVDTHAVLGHVSRKRDAGGADACCDLTSSCVKDGQVTGLGPQIYGERDHIADSGSITCAHAQLRHRLPSLGQDRLPGFAGCGNRVGMDPGDQRNREALPTTGRCEFVLAWLGEHEGKLARAVEIAQFQRRRLHTWRAGPGHGQFQRLAFETRGAADAHGHGGLGPAGNGWGRRRDHFPVPTPTQHGRLHLLPGIQIPAIVAQAHIESGEYERQMTNRQRAGATLAEGDGGDHRIVDGEVVDGRIGKDLHGEG